LKWDKDAIPFSDEMWRNLILDLRMCLIGEEHIDSDDDDADDDDTDLGDDITPASAFEPEWGNENNSNSEPPPVLTPFFITPPHPVRLANPDPVTKRGVPQLRIILRGFIRIGRSILRSILRRLRVHVLIIVGILLSQSQIWAGVILVPW